MAAAESGYSTRRRFPDLRGESLALFSSFFLRGFLGSFSLLILAALVAVAWAWMNGDETRARLAASVPSVTAVLDWNSIAIPPPDSPPAAKPQASESPGTPPPQESRDLGLGTAPLPGLFETSPNGPLPIIRTTDGLTPFDAYRRPFDPRGAAPSGIRGIVSIVLVDMGLSQSATTTAIQNLPPEITLAITPYADQPAFWQEQARAAGHEIWLSLPTPSPGMDPGPQALSDSSGLEANGGRLLWALGRMAGYPGVILQGSAGALESSTQGSALRTPIFTRGLAIADLTPSPSQTIEVAALAAKAKYTSGAILLDSDLRSSAIRESLEALESLAVQKGRAVGVLSPSPVGYQEIVKWIKTLAHKNIALAPLSTQFLPSTEKQKTESP